MFSITANLVKPCCIQNSDSDDPASNGQKSDGREVQCASKQAIVIQTPSTSVLTLNQVKTAEGVSIPGAF